MLILPRVICSQRGALGRQSPLGGGGGGRGAHSASKGGGKDPEPGLRKGLVSGVGLSPRRSFPVPVAPEETLGSSSRRHETWPALAKTKEDTSCFSVRSGGSRSTVSFSPACFHDLFFRHIPQSPEVIAATKRSWTSTASAATAFASAPVSRHERPAFLLCRDGRRRTTTATKTRSFGGECPQKRAADSVGRAGERKQTELSGGRLGPRDKMIREDRGRRQRAEGEGRDGGPFLSAACPLTPGSGCSHASHAILNEKGALLSSSKASDVLLSGAEPSPMRRVPAFWFRCRRTCGCLPRETADRGRSSRWRKGRGALSVFTREGRQRPEEEGEESGASARLPSRPSEADAEEGRTPTPRAAFMSRPNVLADYRPSSLSRPSGILPLPTMLGSSRSLSSTTTTTSSGATTPTSPSTPHLRSPSSSVSASSPSSFSSCGPSTSSLAPLSPSSFFPEWSGGGPCQEKERERLLFSVLQSAVSGVFSSQSEQQEVFKIASSLLHAPLHEVEAFMLRELVPFVPRSPRGGFRSPPLHDTEDLRTRRDKMRVVSCAVAAVLRARPDGLYLQVLDHTSLFWVVFLRHVKTGLLPVARTLLSGDFEASFFSFSSELSLRKRTSPLSSPRKTPSFSSPPRRPSPALRPLPLRRTIPEDPSSGAFAMLHASTPNALPGNPSSSCPACEHVSETSCACAQPRPGEDGKSMTFTAARAVCLEVRYRATVLAGLLSVHSQQANTFSSRPQSPLSAEEELPCSAIWYRSSDVEESGTSERLRQECLQYGDGLGGTQNTSGALAKSREEESEGFLFYLADQARLLVTTSLPLIARGAELLEKATSTQLREIAELGRARASGLASEGSWTSARWKSPVGRNDAPSQETASSPLTESSPPLAVPQIGVCRSTTCSAEGNSHRSCASPSSDAGTERDPSDDDRNRELGARTGGSRNESKDFFECMQENLQILGQAALDHVDLMRLLTLLACRLFQEQARTAGCLSIAADVDTEGERLKKKTTDTKRERENRAEELCRSLEDESLRQVEWGEGGGQGFSLPEANASVGEDKTSANKELLLVSPRRQEKYRQATQNALRTAAKELTIGVGVHGGPLWRLAVTAGIAPCTQAAEVLLCLLEDRPYREDDGARPLSAEHESRSATVRGRERSSKMTKEATRDEGDAIRRTAEARIGFQTIPKSVKDESLQSSSGSLKGDSERLRRPPPWIRQARGRSRVMSAIVRDLSNNLTSLVGSAHNSKEQVVYPVRRLLDQVESLREVLSLLAASPAEDRGARPTPLQLKQLLSSVLWTDLARGSPQPPPVKTPSPVRNDELPDCLGLGRIKSEEHAEDNLSEVAERSGSRGLASDSSLSVLGQSVTRHRELGSELVVLRHGSRTTDAEEARRGNDQLGPPTEAGSYLDRLDDTVSSRTEASEAMDEDVLLLPSLYDSLERRGAYGVLALLWPSVPLYENLLGFTAMALEEKERQFQFLVERALIPFSPGSAGAGPSRPCLLEDTQPRCKAATKSEHAMQCFPRFFEKGFLQVDPHSGSLIPSFVLEKRRRVQLARREQRLAAEELRGISKECLGLTVEEHLADNTKSARQTRHVWWVLEGRVRGRRHTEGAPTSRGAEDVKRNEDSESRTTAGRGTQELGCTSGCPITQEEKETPGRTRHSVLLESEDEDSSDVFREARLIEMEQMTKDSMAGLLVLFDLSTLESACEANAPSESRGNTAPHGNGRQVSMAGQRETIVGVLGVNQAEGGRESFSLFAPHLRRVADILRAWEQLGPSVVSSVTVSTPRGPLQACEPSYEKRDEEDSMWGSVLCNVSVVRDQELAHAPVTQRPMDTQARGVALGAAPCLKRSGTRAQLDSRCGVVMGQARTPQEFSTELSTAAGVGDSLLSSRTVPEGRSKALAKLSEDGGRDSTVDLLAGKPRMPVFDSLYAASQNLYSVERRQCVVRLEDENDRHSGALLKLLSDLQCAVGDFVEALERESLKHGNQLLPQVVSVRAAQSMLDSFVYSLRCHCGAPDDVERTPCCAPPPSSSRHPRSLLLPTELSQPPTRPLHSQLSGEGQASQSGLQAQWQTEMWPRTRRVFHARPSATYGALGWGWEWLSFLRSGRAKPYDRKRRSPVKHSGDQRALPLLDLGSSCGHSGPHSLLFFVPPRPRQMMTVSEDTRLPLLDGLLPTVGGTAVVLSHQSNKLSSTGKKLRKQRGDIARLMTNDKSSGLWLQSMGKLHGLLSYTVRPRRSLPHPSP